jgi:DNA ligase-1
MTLAKFARLNESLEFLTPTQSIAMIKKDWKSFSDPLILTKILTLDYPMNNLGNKKAIKWIASSMGVFDDEIERVASVHLDLGDGVYAYDDNKEYSNITLKQFLRLLTINCSKMDSDSFMLFHEYFSLMNPLEKKWFIRYWVRTPRNGIQSGTVKKLISKVYDKKISIINKHCKYNTLTETVDCYINNTIPPTNLTVGVFVPPMLAKAMKKKDWPKTQILEYKYDGARYQIHKTSESIIIFNRRGKIVNNQYPDIIEMLNEWQFDSFILDTEIYPITNNGSPAPFQSLGTRIHSKNHDEAAQKCPVTLAVFDCLALDGKTLIDEPLSLRIAAMEALPNQAVRTYNDYRAFYSQAIALGFEGIMIKNADATYDTGKRSKHWVKYKPPQIDLDIVILGARYGDGKNGNVFSSFDMGVISDNGFTNIGSLGSGFTDSELIMMTNKLKPLTNSYENGTYLLSPRIVLTVTADLVSKNKDNTYGLRFPRMKKIRDDKLVTEINTIDDVAVLV